MMLTPIVFFVALVPGDFACGQFQEDSLDRDYGAELPRIEPKSPSESLASFDIADGFRIELVASEPLIHDPVAMTFDEFGRLFVVEMRGYSEQGEQRLAAYDVWKTRTAMVNSTRASFHRRAVLADGDCLLWRGCLCWRGTGRLLLQGHQ